MRFRLFFLFLTILNGYQYCPKPTFVDEFDKGLSVMWETTTDKHAPGSVSLYTPFNVKTEAGKLVLSVNKIGTTDSNGEFILQRVQKFLQKLNLDMVNMSFVLQSLV